MSIFHKSEVADANVQEAGKILFMPLQLTKAFIKMLVSDSRGHLYSDQDFHCISLIISYEESFL